MFRFSIENFRGLAILFVMISHLESFLYIDGAWRYLIFFFGGATSWFVFISGYLFAYLEFGKFNFRRYLKKKFKFVLLPYLILSLLLVSLGLFYGRPDFYGLSATRYVAWALVVGSSVVPPLWFIPMICLFFLITPFLNAWRDNPLIYVVLVLALVFTLFSGRPVGNSNPFLSFSHFLGLYLLGVIASMHVKAMDALSPAWALVLMGLGGLGFVMASLIYPGVDVAWTFSRDLWHLNVMEVGKLSLLVSVFVGFEKFYNRRNAVLSYVANISFGLFFVHSFYLGVIYKVVPYVDVTGIGSMILLEAAVLLSLSFATVIGIQKALGSRSRYVIGC